MNEIGNDQITIQYHEAGSIAFGGKKFTELTGNIFDGNGGPLTIANGPYWITAM